MPRVLPDCLAGAKKPQVLWRIRNMENPQGAPGSLVTGRETLVGSDVLGQNRNSPPRGTRGAGSWAGGPRGEKPVVLKQRPLGSERHISGVGLHSGRPVRL